ncbi:NUDIX hydrolase [Arachidicoccus ginsenosidimutans]|uniref:NUDIX hydrolase n=1 Tax=Arachidicoccus sp. BS20 TaxID=1850526 RepID=UPI000A7E1C65|nr:NUDIX domain-containing protein [Arachidicoccus sp. BS20]
MEKSIIVAAGGLVFNGNNELLMIFRRGFWDLPKGKLDEGEAIESCALREVEEETGLTNIQLEELIGITYHDYFDKWTNRDVRKETHWFKMFVSGSPELTPQTEEDIEKAEWATTEEVAAHLQNSYPNIVEIVNKSDFVS